MTAQELDELLTVCRKHNVTVFTDGNIRVAFSASGAPVSLPATPAMVPVPKGQRRMTDTERFLFAATEGFPSDEEAFVPVEQKPQ